MDQHWLTIIIVLLIIGIIIDGLRRMRKARKDSIKMALRPVQRSEPAETKDGYGSEFPNGGARASNREIDIERIQQARSKYDFGNDIPAWHEKVADTLATMGSDSEKQADTAARIEPSVDADPLLDPVSESTCDASLDTEESAIKSNQASKPQQTEVVTDADLPPQKPVQAKLNLEDAVPMLMDSLQESDVPEDVSVSLHASPRQQPIRTVGTPIDAQEEDDDLALETRSANKPRYESRYVDHKTSTPAETPQDVLVMHVRAAKDEYFHGSDLLELILNNELRFGEMDIFHRHADQDGEGPILFSMANMVKPGIFDLHSFDEFSTVGLSFFLTLPNAGGDHMAALETMLKTARNIADTLSGELLDEQRSALTGQTVEHYRERVRDFVRKQQLEKNKQ